MSAQTLLSAAPPLPASGFQAPEAFESLDAWGQCVTGALMNLDFARSRDGFRGQFRRASFQEAVTCELIGRPHRTTRSARRLKEADNDFMVLLYLRRGSAAVSHRAFEGRLESGSFFLIDGSQPHMLDMQDDFEHVAFRCSRARLASMHHAVPALVGRPVAAREGPAALAAGMLDALASSKGLDEYATLAAVDAVVRLLAHAVESGEGAPMWLHRQQRLMARILSALIAHCPDPSYCANQLAAEIGISRRYLDRLLSTLGTSFGKLLLEKRLARCHEQLLDPRFRSAPITAMAFENGFNDLSHFSRAFRNRYGCSAREAREAPPPHSTE